MQSTAFGVAYRVIGGLGSDTINVTGDVTKDIVTRELEGVSGTVDHRLMSLLDRFYDGLAVDGIDYNLATPERRPRRHRRRGQRGHVDPRGRLGHGAGQSTPTRSCSPTTRRTTST